MKTLKTIIYFLSLSLLISCSSRSTSEVFFRDNLDLGYVTTIAVMPFENNSNDRYAAERLRDITITKILALKNFDVVDKGIIDNQLKNEAVAISGANLDVQTMERIGQLIDSQALLLGTIDSAAEKRRGAVSYHQLTITLRLVDAATGTILWHGTGSRNGDSFGSRIFGVAPDDEFGVAFKLLDELIQTIPTRSETTITQNPEEPTPEPDEEISNDQETDYTPESVNADESDNSANDGEFEIDNRDQPDDNGLDYNNLFDNNNDIDNESSEETIEEPSE